MSATLESRLFVNPAIENRKRIEADFIDKLYILSELSPSFLWEECVLLMKALMNEHGVFVPACSTDDCNREEKFFDRLNAMDCQGITTFARVCNNYLEFSNLK